MTAKPQGNHLALGGPPGVGVGDDLAERDDHGDDRRQESHAGHAVEEPAEPQERPGHAQ